MAFTSKFTASRGTLLELKDALKIIQNGRDILKIKRDRLIEELNNLLNEIALRQKLEKQLTELYVSLKEALSSLGYETVSSIASSISKIEVNVTPISIMGVVVPKIVIEEKPQLDSIEDLSLREIAEKVQELVGELLNLAQIESTIERISQELMALNRKVNALDKVIIPRYSKQIKYIEDLLFDEDLEEFNRTKHVRNVLSRRRT